MVGLAVLPEALAVIADGRDQRAGAESRMREQPADLRVHVRDLAGVGVARPGRRERLGRRVLGVRVVEVDPEEESRLRRRAVEPGERAIDGVGRWSLGVAAERAARRAAVVVVDGEALGQTVSTLEHRRRHEGGGGEALALEHLGEGRGVLAEEVRAVVADAVAAWGRCR